MKISPLELPIDIWSWEQLFPLLAPSVWPICFARNSWPRYLLWSFYCPPSVIFERCLNRRYPYNFWYDLLISMNIRLGIDINMNLGYRYWWNTIKLLSYSPPRHLCKSGPSPKRASVFSPQKVWVINGWISIQISGKNFRQLGWGWGVWGKA